ncbi:MAG: hypothetical protein OXE73_00325 [Gammaproteobacteria bacterium]|nr:hypothetical protein [Gammaproteobacteria bacterium]
MDELSGTAAPAARAGSSTDCRPGVPRRTLEATPTGLAARMADRLFCRFSESNFCDEFVRFDDIFGHSND